MKHELCLYHSAIGNGDSFAINRVSSFIRTQHNLFYLWRSKNPEIPSLIKIKLLLGRYISIETKINGQKFREKG